MTRSEASTKGARVARDPRWRKVEARDAEADGSFVFAVRTTGVYCRPSCGARTPRPENVAFFATCRDAEQAGFRACKRCRPGAQPPRAARAELAARLCRFIEAANEPPSLAALAAEAKQSASHVHRLFKEHTGLTPRAYARAVRDERARAALARGSSVTEALYEAGFNSSGRFYERAGRALGMAPRSFRAGGAGEALDVAVERASLGLVLVAATARGVCAILLGDDEAALRADLARRFPRAETREGTEAFRRLVARVLRAVERPERAVDLPLDLRGTALQRRVYEELMRIPAGQTVSYGELAVRIGQPRAVRAVASACASNALAVAVPCHRVLRGNGDLAGYRWGLSRKQALLSREQRVKRR